MWGFSHCFRILFPNNRRNSAQDSRLHSCTWFFCWFTNHFIIERSFKLDSPAILSSNFRFVFSNRILLFLANFENVKKNAKWFVRFQNVFFKATSVGQCGCPQECNWLRYAVNWFRFKILFNWIASINWHSELKFKWPPECIGVYWSAKTLAKQEVWWYKLNQFRFSTDAVWWMCKFIVASKVYIVFDSKVSAFQLKFYLVRKYWCIFPKHQFACHYPTHMEPVLTHAI